MEAGENFCVILTASGRPILCGNLPVMPSQESYQGLVIAEIENLPPVTQIASGHRHALLSNGDRVWSVGM